MREIKKFGSALFFTASLLLVMVGASGCHHRHHAFVQVWYDVYGFHCGDGQPRPGCNFYWDGSKIVDASDPYFYSSYFLQYATWVYTDSYGFSRAYIGWGWLSPSGILYDDFGIALNEDAGKQGVDVIAGAAEASREVVKNVGKSLADRYALSEDVGLQIATTLNDFAIIGKTRARTEKDTADFTKRLYGVTQESVTQALELAKTGDLKVLENLNMEVAAHWGTNSETSKAILKKWFKDEVTEYSIK